MDGHVSCVRSRALYAKGARFLASGARGKALLQRGERRAAVHTDPHNRDSVTGGPATSMAYGRVHSEWRRLRPGRTQATE